MEKKMRKQRTVYSETVHEEVLGILEVHLSNLKEDMKAKGVFFPDAVDNAGELVESAIERWWEEARAEVEGK